jgi:putative glutamine amidotransferase
MRPLIGITMSLEEKRFTLTKYYTEAITQAGGVPLLIPHLSDERLLQQISEQLDGLLLSGGGDMDPNYFHEEPHIGLGSVDPLRDRTEVQLVQLFIQQKKPIFAICRGCQVLNVALGGDLYQDLYSQKENIIQHQQKAPQSYATHFIEIKQPSLLAEILGDQMIRVNSFHHQAVRKLGKDLIISAYSNDGVIEAIESTVAPFILGVQWHPECMTSTDFYAKKLFSAFIEACQNLSVFKPVE